MLNSWHYTTTRSTVSNPFFCGPDYVCGEARTDGRLTFDVAASSGSGRYLNLLLSGHHEATPHSQLINKVD
jgi:hypothetical protein